MAPLVQQIQETVLVNLERTLFENIRIAMFDVATIYDPETNELKPIKDWPAEARACVKKIKTRLLFGEGADGKGAIGTVTEVELWDKGAAIDRLMKHLGAYAKDNAPEDPHSRFTYQEIRAFYELLRADHERAAVSN